MTTTSGYLITNISGSHLLLDDISLPVGGKTIVPLLSASMVKAATGQPKLLSVSFYMSYELLEETNNDIDDITPFEANTMQLLSCTDVIVDDAVSVAAGSSIPVV